LLYQEINWLTPGIIKYYNPLKNYLKQTQSWDSLLVYTEAFSKARNNDLQAKLEFLELYIMMDANDKWHSLAITLILESSLDEKSIKNIIQRLISAGEFDFTYSLLTSFREQTGKRDFYSIELGSYLGMRMSFEKSTTEYLIFLENHPQQMQTISDRIMAFPNDPSINAIVKSILRKSPITASKFILADLQFKLKEFDQAYETLKDNNASVLMLLNFGKDLVTISEYVRAETVFSQIIQTTENEAILTQTIFEIAKIAESKMFFSQIELSISGFYPGNSFFSSPFVPLKEKSGTALQQAMAIYDSLRVTKKNAQAAYRLAEVQFRVLGDLDGALYLYEEAFKHGNSKGLRIDAGLGMVNISIAKGNLSNAEEKCNELMKTVPDELLYQIKLAQILFYQGEFDKTDASLRKIIKQTTMDNEAVNDIFDVISVLIAFRHNQDEFVEFAKAQLNIQQNKRAEALEKLASLFDTNEIYISDLCRYQHAWLTYLQGGTNDTKNQLDEIMNETIFQELAFIFQAEILDYIDKDISAAIDSYLDFLEQYPKSIYYDDIRLRLRELAN
jgi:tetratricopeptide (TPR) repeat protein